ncbi:Stp1/IreP family PP2C-type Ser/Thr phosphatase [Candidatus Albibeggiatoa sp. nov. BB20]|uniref:Stp1/IreP family PP2C-type Ser/Thr phosphatase n=1 Tax=Candidatus Albibeggiatoa sp. nov. BB20 TaxID=3162723 RepID=UPI0033658EC5
MRLEMSYLSDTGLVRDHNEDYLSCDETLGLVVLADGMGGYQAGEVASEIAVQTVMSNLTELAESATEENDNPLGTHTSVQLEQSIVRANQSIFKAAEEQTKYHGMGTTIVATLFHDNTAFIAHVGDSRLYRLRHREFKALTKDHSVLQDLIDCGYYTPEQARHSPNRNLVTRALGVSKIVNVDVQEQFVLANDIYLLCSDGLNDMLEDIEIYNILSDCQHDLSLATQNLVDAANNKGGEDNISVILVKVLIEDLNQDKNWWQKLVNFRF